VVREAFSVSGSFRHLEHDIDDRLRYQVRN